MSEDRLWWKHGVMYQIYPRSFYDANGDGTGDIPGITAKLDYLQDLGIEGIWLSPINVSPMFDFGYDISNYNDIDPVFGKLADFEKLIKEAHNRGIRIITDLVMNHTSHLHPWFIESASSKNNPKRDWYLWKDPVKGRMPNNWMAAFGGRAWEFDKKTGQYYLHLFLTEQPDVNWRNPELKKAMFDMIRFWLDKGVDGFRLDVCNFFIKDAQFKNNPFGIGPNAPRPYDLQNHIYDRDQPETHGILKEFRSILDGYSERMSVGEIAVENPGGNHEIASSFYGIGNDELHLVFDFSHMNGKWGADVFYKRIREWQAHIPDGDWPCHVFNNHDQFRSISRYIKGAESIPRAKLIAVMLLTLKGTPFIYYGEELGMKNGSIPKKILHDPLGIKYWPFHPGRDPERTPMQWSDAPNAGFSTASPWLPVNNDYDVVNVASELADKNSILNLYKDLIGLRKKHPALQRGDWIPVIEAKNDILAYKRVFENEVMLIVLNFSNAARKADLVSPSLQTVLSTHRFKGSAVTERMVNIMPYEASIFTAQCL
jgi:alpha-glucosidase